MPALPIIVLAEQGYSLPDWFVNFLLIFAFAGLVPFAITLTVTLIKILKGDTHE